MKCSRSCPAFEWMIGRYICAITPGWHNERKVGDKCNCKSQDAINKINYDLWRHKMYLRAAIYLAASKNKED